MKLDVFTTFGEMAQAAVIKVRLHRLILDLRQAQPTMASTAAPSSFILEVRAAIKHVMTRLGRAFSTTQGPLPCNDGAK